jgi:hypothetical protein
MARGSIVKRCSGNYAIVYYVDGKQRWETIGPSRREAERALTARKREVDTGAWREPSSETLATYAERWLASPIGIRPASRADERAWRRRHSRSIDAHSCPTSCRGSGRGRLHLSGQTT